MGDGPRIGNRESFARLFRNLQSRNDSPRSRSCDSGGSQSIGVIMKTVNLKEKFGLFSDYCNPRVIGEVNDCHVKAVKLKGEFIWHHHESEDELFLVVKGTLRMKFRGHQAVFTDGDELSDDQMLAIAREMNLSETVFVQKPTEEAALARLRIFTTKEELKLAGHPVIGTWFLLAGLGVVPARDGGVHILQETGAGVL